MSTQRPFREISRQRFFQVATLSSVLSWVVMTGLIAWRALPVVYGKTAVPLHYNIHIGVDDVGPWWRIFMVPFLGLLFLIVNVLLARFMWTRDPMLSYVVAATTVAIEVLLLTASVFIIFNSLAYA